MTKKTAPKMRVEVNTPSRETPKAWGIDMGDSELVVTKSGRSYRRPSLTWIPKSVGTIEPHRTDGLAWLTVPAWLGRKHGLHLAIKHGRGAYV